MTERKKNYIFPFVLEILKYVCLGVVHIPKIVPILFKSISTN